ncbi:MAG: IS5 family transposase, partial [Firmicutes bacterium]|nr:IS5 family transposase [Bacillota bacterium]
MYKKADRAQLSIEEFYLPFGGQLNADNRWVKLARLMPWDMVEDIYAEKFKNDREDGAPPIP